MTEEFKTDVDKGLSSEPKMLPSKYFYDARGDELFVQIMNLPEYYLTRAEMEIFSNQTAEMVQALEVNPNQPFELVELGAGDGTKTKKLLEYLLSNGYQFSYFPVDISENALSDLQASLKEEMPQLSVQTVQGDYFEVLQRFSEASTPRVVLFLGSNLGNMSDARAQQFIHALGHNLNNGDKLLVGLDLIKSADIVIPAYNDSSGVTAEFNLNLLLRINRELGGNFDTTKFKHVVSYSEEDGIVKSYLQSQVDQKVTIEVLKKTYAFKQGETIHTEISRKYNDELLKKFLNDAPLTILKKLTDSKGYFADYILLKG